MCEWEVCVDPSHLYGRILEDRAAQILEDAFEADLQRFRCVGGYPLLLVGSCHRFQLEERESLAGWLRAEELICAVQSDA